MILKKDQCGTGYLHINLIKSVEDINVLRFEVRLAKGIDLGDRSCYPWRGRATARPEAKLLPLRMLDSEEPRGKLRVCWFLGPILREFRNNL